MSRAAEYAATFGVSLESAEWVQDVHMRPKAITPAQRGMLDLKRKLYDARLNRIRGEAGLSIGEREQLARKRSEALFGAVVLNELDVSVTE